MAIGRNLKAKNIKRKVTSPLLPLMVPSPPSLAESSEGRGGKALHCALRCINIHNEGKEGTITAVASGKIPFARCA